VTVTRTSDTITAHDAGWAAAKTCTLSLPGPQTRLGDPPDPPGVLTAIDDLLNTRTSTEIASTLSTTRGPDQRRRQASYTRTIGRSASSAATTCAPAATGSVDTGLLTLTEMAAELSVSKTTVKDWYQRRNCHMGSDITTKAKSSTTRPDPNPPALPPKDADTTLATCTNAT